MSWASWEMNHRKISMFLVKNAIHNVPKKLTTWLVGMLETLHMWRWNRNQFYSSVILTTLAMQHWHQRHIVNQAVHLAMQFVCPMSRQDLVIWPKNSQAGPAPSHTWKGQGNVEYLSCTCPHCDYSRNPIRLQWSLAWTMNPISLTVQDGEYLGKRNCFHEAANQATKALRYDCIREQKRVANNPLVVLCFCVTYEV